MPCWLFDLFQQCLRHDLAAAWGGYTAAEGVNRARAEQGRVWVYEALYPVLSEVCLCQLSAYPAVCSIGVWHGLCSPRHHQSSVAVEHGKMMLYAAVRAVQLEKAFAIMMAGGLA